MPHRGHFADDYRIEVPADDVGFTGQNMILPWSLADTAVGGSFAIVKAI